ncbi:SAGA-associated factor 29 family protein [Aspergillus ibericus CBS 121593]|uniref:SAGA complex component n=1 Tax=Aspergillus ibericus CBS 121593 TaxID=1448316 RepID=A0A395GT47_9EURO|nr:SAGA complex component [Aspergillus ibericus CBS 121593]RAK98596.1 SAGA complex component [Aspergillus ibericus CBS 121593]
MRAAERLPPSREGKLSAQTRSPNDGVPEAPDQVPASPSQSAGPNRLSTPDHPFAANPSPQSPSTAGRPHSLRHGAARGTRSSTRKDLHSAFEWEALNIQKTRTSAAFATPAESSNCLPRKATVAAAATAAVVVAADPSLTPKEMSRNRPRGPPVPRDNGLAANEETDMWNKILQDLRKAKEKNEKQKALAEQIAALNEKIGREGGKPSLSEHNHLDSLYRQMLKLCEDERAILQDEPSDVIKNLGLLTALRQASEAEAPQNRAASFSKSRKKRNDLDGSATDSPGPSSNALPDKVSRTKGGVQRSTSVSSTQVRDGRDIRDSGVYVKIEEGAESTKGTLAERSGHLVVGAEVVFKHNKNKQGVEGEGIQCIIKGISGDGVKKRYDVQDPEPNENGEQGAVYKTTAASLIPIPQIGSTLPSFSLGKQVLARYPDTTTFYRAEVMGSRKDVYRLKFEGEEDDKEMEVDRRFVLDIPGK